MTRDASQEQIRTAYRRLARRHHPDFHPGSDASRFRAIHEAYRSLTDGGRQAGGDTADPPPQAAPDRPPAAPPKPAGPPEPASAPEPDGSPLAAASILVPLAAVVCAPGPLLLCGVLLAPVGAVLGHVARRQGQRNGRPGSGLAVAGIVAGWGLTAVLLAAIVVGVLISRG